MSRSSVPPPGPETSSPQVPGPIGASAAASSLPTSLQTPPSGFRAVLGALWTGNLFAPFLMSSVTAILPAMGRDLRATAVHLSLIMLIYSLAQAVFNILGGRFGDMWGRRRVLLAGVVMFTVVTVAMGLAPDIGSMMGLRFLQGMAAAMISSCSTAIAISMAPLSRRGQVMGVLTSAVYLGLTLGPVVGGGIATAFNWRWLFLGICAPGCAVWMVLRRFIRQEWRDARGEPLDVAGALLLLAGLSMVALGAGGIGIQPELLWLTPPGFILLGVFVRHEWRAVYPILDLRTFRRAEGLGTGMLATFINYGSTMGLVFFFSLYLQQVRGFTPFNAGLIMVLQSLVQVVASPLGGRLADKLGAERVSAGGMVLCGLGILGVSMLDRASPIVWLTGSQVLLGIGVGLFNAPNMVATLSHVENRHLAVASGLMGSMRTMGGLFSQVLISLVVGHYMGNAPMGPDNVDVFLDAMRASLLCFGVLNLCGILIGLKRLLPRREKA